MAVSDQGVQRIGVFVDDKSPDLRADIHGQTDRGEGCSPVGRQFGLVVIQPSLPSWDVKGVLVAPKWRIVVKGPLYINK